MVELQPELIHEQLRAGVVGVSIGQVLGPGGGLMPAREALSSYGLTEFSLGPKEGIALIQGVPGVTGLSVLRLDEAAALT